jgi:hypothetical protein
MTGQHALIVPPLGLLELVHADQAINEEETLRLRGEGQMVHLQFGDTHVYWLHDNTGRHNPRARDVLTELSGAQVVFTGHVIFEGIDEQQLGEIVARLSMRA